MRLMTEELQRELSRDIYWCRLRFESENQEKKSTVLVCATREYLDDLYHVQSINQKKLNQWYQTVIKKWKEMREESIFNKSIHYDIYTDTLEGYNNGLEFLKGQVKP